MSEAKKQGVLGHLRELRTRLLRSLIVLAVTTTVSFFFADQIIEILKQPAGDIEFVFIEVTEGFSTYMRVCFTAGIILAMPWLMGELLFFVTPALTPRENRMVFVILPWVILMFAGGIYFGYRFLIPPATHFLLSFGSNVATIQPRLSNYINFITRLVLIIGLIFEMPVVTTFLARIGVISYRWLANKRKIWIVLAFVISAIITPTPDAINQSIVAGTLIVLFEISIWLAWLVEKRKKKTKNASV